MIKTGNILAAKIQRRRAPSSHTNTKPTKLTAKPKQSNRVGSKHYGVKNMFTSSRTPCGAKQTKNTMKTTTTAIKQKTRLQQVYICAVRSELEDKVLLAELQAHRRSTEVIL